MKDNFQCARLLRDERCGAGEFTPLCFPSCVQSPGQGGETAPLEEGAQGLMAADSVWLSLASWGALFDIYEQLISA